MHICNKGIRRPTCTAYPVVVILYKICTVIMHMLWHFSPVCNPIHIEIKRPLNKQEPSNHSHIHHHRFKNWCWMVADSSPVVYMPTRGFQVCHGYQNRDSKDALVWSIWRDDQKKSQHVEQKMLGCDIYSERSQFLVVCRNGHRQCRSYVTDINLVVSGLSTGSWWGLPLANIWVMAALGSFPVSVSKICAFWYSNVFARYLDDDIVWIRVRASMVLYEWNETTLLATSRRLQLTWVAWSKHSRATASI